MKYLIIAGEPSGDLHASRLISALAIADADAQFVFLGGDMMARSAGKPPVIHYRDMAFMGFVEVAKNLSKIFSNLRVARKLLETERPDALILVDYPSFNLKVAKTARRLGIPCYWYISPKIWAWKAWRVKAIRKYVRKVLCILPFEPQWYKDHNYPHAEYVGNPTMEELGEALANAPQRDEFLKEHRLRNRPIIALMPGSRRGEIADNLPIMNDVARQFPQYNIVVAAAPGIPDEFYKKFTQFQVIRNASHAILAHSHAALVTSGTATLEAAIARVPQVVLYRSNGSRISYQLMKPLLHIEFVSLPNLIANESVVPEMLLHFCTVENVAERLRLITPDNSPERLQMLQGYEKIARMLSKPGAAANAAGAIVSQQHTQKSI